MAAKLESIGKAEAAFQEMTAFVQDAIASGELRIDEVERTLFEVSLQVNHHLLAGFIAAAGDGDEGEIVERDGTSLTRSEEKKTKPYRSIFGVLTVERYVYARGPHQKVQWAPVDARLGLPAGEQSYVLEDWLQRRCVHGAFQEEVSSLRDLLGVTTSVRAAEVMNRRMAAHVEGFRDSRAPPDADAEDEILVLAADGKGVPMRRPLEERLQAHAAEVNGEHDLPPKPSAATSGKPKRRLGRGEKRTRKQMAYVGAVYSVAPFVRTPDQILDEVCRRQRQAERPRPKSKQVFAEMTRFSEDQVLSGQEQCFAGLAFSAIRRGADKPLVCLMDGQKSLWNLKESWFPRAVGILDVFHVLERLWQIAHAFHGEGTCAAERHVERHLRLLLEGKVGSVVGVCKRDLALRGLTGSQAKTVTEVLTYFTNNKQYMRYDEYLAAGYPIGTGVVEGACRHFVKDRMERAGMRWEIEGAQPMLSLRAVCLNDQWDDFIQYRIQTEQAALYGQTA